MNIFVNSKVKIRALLNDWFMMTL